MMNYFKRHNKTHFFAVLMLMGLSGAHKGWADCVSSSMTKSLIGSYGDIVGPPNTVVTAVVNSAQPRIRVANTGTCWLRTTIGAGPVGSYYILYTTEPNGPVKSFFTSNGLGVDIKAYEIVGVRTDNGIITFRSPAAGEQGSFTWVTLSKVESPVSLIYDGYIDGHYTVVAGNIDSLNETITLPQVSSTEFNGKGSVIRDKAQTLGLSVTTVATTNISLRLTGNIDNAGLFIPNEGENTGVGVCILNTDSNNCINANEPIRLANNLKQELLNYSLAYVQRDETVKSGNIRGQITLSIVNQ
ncbi:fimbrial protein [Pantoea endophytica]